MHDCFGKPLRPFDRVRAATKEELEAQGHPEAAYSVVSLSPPEQFVLPAYYGTDTCNVQVVAEVVAQAGWPPDAVGAQPIVLSTRGTVTTQTARALVRLD